MKQRKWMRWMLTLIAAALIASPALAAEDFSAYSFDELLEIRASLDAEMLTRPECVRTLSAGQYIAGQDIPAGTYVLTLNRENEERDSVDYYVYETQGMYAYDVDRLWLGDLPLKDGRIEADGSATVDLYEGYCLVAYRNGLNLRMERKLSGRPGDDYVPPEGTLVPIGYYTVGDEIPAGTYSVYYAGTASARFRVYNTMEDAKNDFADEEITLVVSHQNPSGTAYLREGQIVRIEYNDVLLKKSADFSFD